MRKKKLISVSITILILGICCFMGFILPETVTVNKSLNLQITGKQPFYEVYYNQIILLLYGMLLIAVLISIYLYRKYYMYPRPQRNQKQKLTKEQLQNESSSI